MIKVIIDGVEFETSSGTAIAMSFDTAHMNDLDSARDVVDIEVQVKCDSTRSSLFGGEGYLHVAERFNQTLHTAQLCCESVVVFEGEATLRSAKRSGAEVTYTIRIRRGGAAWANNAATELLSELEVSYLRTLTEYNIEQSWTNSDIVKFFPVHRDSYSEVYSSSTGNVVNKITSIDGYHPFINVHKVLETIFTNAGYTIESSIMDSSWFQKLYMSGAYSSQNSTTAKSTMDFYVIKSEDVSATADYRGRVSMTPYVASNTVGNFVDVGSIDENAECYSRSSCFKLVDGVPCFVPLSQVSVGFEYHFKYLSEYSIKSRTELAAFNTFYLESGGEITINVANNFVDQRGESLISNFEYLAMIFDHESSDDGDVTYRYMIYENGILLSSTEWSTRTTTIITPTISSSSSVTTLLYVSYDGGTSYSIYGGDWALYQGYVAVSGEMEIDVTIRTPPESVSPSSPKYFSGHYVDGAEMGMKFTLLTGTTLTPYFAAYPGVGSYINFEDVSQLGVYQSSVISAMQHMFNLQIFTDHTAKRLYIEPLEELYDRSQLWDWSDKIVAGADVTYSDVANESYATRKLGYQQADGATTRSQEFGYEPGETYPDAPEEEPTQSVDGSWSTEYGSWSVYLDNYGAKQSSSTSLSPLFSPTLNDTDGLPIVGDRDDEELVDTLEFSPRIVSFLGMMSSGNETIPYTSFHSPSSGFSLCFEDRDQLSGLNRYYAEQVARELSSQYVTLYLNLSPLDMVALLSPTDGMASVLSTFTFEIDGEWCECRMDSLINYDLGSGVATCRFLIVG